MASIMSRVLLAASLLAAHAAGYKAQKYGAMIKAATTGSSAESGFHIQEGAPANVTELTPQYFLDRGSKRAEVLYGPFDVRPMSDGNGMEDYLQIAAKMPCEDCTITYVHAGLQYPDGSYANANTSLWLHHVVFLHLGVPDTVCGLDFYGKGQRWFASGNERTVTDMSLSGAIPAGYYWPKEGINMFLLELMNQAMIPQEAVLSVTYEWVPGQPSDFYQVTPIWLDIGGCGGDSDEPVRSDTTFHYDSPTYDVGFDGAIIDMGGHLHDGGVYLDIVKDDEVLCEVDAFYGQTAGYWDQAGIPMTMNSTSVEMQMSMGDMRMPHISSMGYCRAPAGFVTHGDILGVNAYYNLTEYSPMLNADGSDADIMGISLVYAAINMTASELQSFVGNATPNPYPNGTFVPHITPYSPNADMVCIPSRDSPGTLSARTLDLSNQDSAMLYLMAILDDACLQVWSQGYAHGFWYGIAAVIAMFTLVNRGQMLQHLVRKRSAARTGGLSSSRLGSATSRIAGAFRAVSYPRITPTNAPFSFQITTFGTSLMILAYAAFICILSLVHTNTHDDQRYQSVGVRAAWISMAQLPLIVVLANKRNFVGLVTGVTYERLNVLHRWTARGLLLTTTFHFGFQSYGWARLGLMKLEWSSDTCPPTGIAAYALLLWINLSTFVPLRAMSYEFFVLQHIITFFGLIIAIMYHIPSTALGARNYVWAAIGLYLASRLIQTVAFAWRNIRPSRATLMPVSANVTKITLANRSLKSWTPGSHVLIRFPRFGFWQSHPVSIASTPTSHKGDLVFYVRSHKGFTGKLFKTATQSPSETHLALIDGPYGGAQPDFGAFSSVVLIASSTGISFTLPILLDLAYRASRHQLPVVKRITFVWAAKDDSATAWVPSELKHAIQTLRDEGVRTDIEIHITGASTRGAVVDRSAVCHERKTLTCSCDAGNCTCASSESSGSSIHSGSGASQDSGEKKQAHASIRPVLSKSDSNTSWDDNITVTRGRCDVSALLREEHAAAGTEMGVAVCGSLELATEVRNTVARMQGGSKGVFLHVEGFGW